MERTPGLEAATWVAGVDGCRAGWLVVSLTLAEPGAWHIRLYRHFADLLVATPLLQVIAVDMPIGLLDLPTPGGRQCDQQARRLLGRKASSIFSPPSRLSLAATDYDEVRGQGVSRQSFGILPKIREIDQLMTPTLQQRVYEAHPELAFCGLAGRPLQHSKKTAAGYAERLCLLSALPVFQGVCNAEHSAGFPRTQVAPDDVLDAAILSWVAYGIARRQVRRVPSVPPLDARGLRMEICFCDATDYRAG